MKRYDFYTLEFPHNIGEKSTLTNYNNRMVTKYSEINLFHLLSNLSEDSFLIIQIDDREGETIVYLQKEI